MPTVLHLRTVTGRGGGPEKTLLTSPRFIGDGYDLRLAYIRPADDPAYDMPQRAAQAGIALIDIPERNGFDPQTWRRLVAEIKQSRPAILHAHDYKTNVLGVMLGRRFGLPVMTTLHGYGLGGGRLNWYYRIERWALRRMDRVVVVSEDLRHYALKQGVHPERCVLIENAIDTGEYVRTIDVEEARARVGVSCRSMLVGGVGRLCAEKAFDRLIRAVHELNRGSAAAELLLIGEGDERSRLENLVRELACEQTVRLLGYRADTMTLYQALDVFVLSSLREASPNVVLEAMAMEVPVIATRIAGVPKLIEDGVNGLLVEPDDVQGLTQALLRLMSDNELRKRLAQAARQTVATKYSFAVRMQKMRSIYDNLLGRTEAVDSVPTAGVSTPGIRSAHETVTNM